MDAARHAPGLLDALSDGRGEFDFFLVQILAGQLRQDVDLALQGVIQALVGVAEIDGGIPHLQIEERRSRLVVKIGSFAAAEDLGRIDIVNGVAKGTIPRFVAQQVALSH